MPDKDKNAIGRLLSTCSEIESLAGEFYRSLARLHGFEPDAAALLLKTACEEDNHKLQFELGRRLSSAIVSGAALDQEKADRVLKSFNDAITKLATSTSPPTVQSALKYAIRMENLMMDLHMDHSIVFTSDSYREMFTAMMDQDCQHIQALKDYLERCESGDGRAKTSLAGRR